MTKSRYWTLVGLVSAGIAAVFSLGIFEVSRVYEISTEKILAYVFLFFGFSITYFGFLRPHWFAKELIPTASPIKLKVPKKVSAKPSLKDDSYFWNVFPHALFFSVAGITYLLQPNPLSIVVALGCSAWVKILYKYV